MSLMNEIPKLLQKGHVKGIGRFLQLETRKLKLSLPRSCTFLHQERALNKDDSGTSPHDLSFP